MTETNNNKFFMVYVEGRRTPKKRHPTIESAIREARRLVGLNPGCNIHVLSIAHTIPAEAVPVKKRLK